MNRRKLTIGLFGFGCVGYGQYEVLDRTPGLKTTIKKICVKHQNKERALPIDRFTFNKDVLFGFFNNSTF
jgi:homoserine dehydrogenase